MWVYKSKYATTMRHFLDTTYDKLWRVLFKPQKDDWPAEDEEDIGLDAEHPPKKVTRLLSILRTVIHITVD